LRYAADTAAIGRSGALLLPVTRTAYGPIPGPTALAAAQSQAMREVARLLSRFATVQREMITQILLLNRTLRAWCQDAEGRNPQLEMGRLLGILDLLAEHYSAEIDEDLAHGRTPAA
jgi:hypothetical protein